MKVHWFNPDNDLALASGLSTYTPPAAALQLRRDGAMLPAFYAEPGDLVWDGESPFPCGGEPVPWGWSAAARSHFLRHGCPADVLPSPEEIDSMRNLSHRRTARFISSLCTVPNARLAGRENAVEAFSMEDVRGFLAREGAAVLKAPWSSSGRGVVDTRNVQPEKVLKMAEDSIRRQGSVMVEHAWNKVLDFAMLFETGSGGNARYLGSSVFTTDTHGAYRGNLLASEPDRLAVIERCFPVDKLMDVVEALREIFAREIAPYYAGVLGVDMLVTAEGWLVPVVEINLRKTMGYVALKISEGLKPGERGEFRVNMHHGRFSFDCMF